MAFLSVTVSIFIMLLHHEYIILSCYLLLSHRFSIRFKNKFEKRAPHSLVLGAEYVLMSSCRFAHTKRHITMHTQIHHSIFYILFYILHEYLSFNYSLNLICAKFCVIHINNNRYLHTHWTQTLSLSLSLHNPRAHDNKTICKCNASARENVYA